MRESEQGVSAGGERFGLSLVDTFKTWSAMSCQVSVMALGSVLLLAALGQA